MELILFGIDIVLQIDFDIVVHLCVNVLAQEAADDGDALPYVSLNERKVKNLFYSLRS